jgi:peptidoglycan/xylan/chitin deacetylase (PgdA/CDA1 family)
MSACKRIITRAISISLFFLGAFKSFQSIVNRFRFKDRTEGTRSPFFTVRRPRNIQILAYHRVNDDKDPFFPAMPIKSFARQMEILSKYFTVCSLNRVLQNIKSGDIPENAVAVTLDDGYRDNYLYAFPILKRYSIPATIFLATDAIGTQITLWHDRIFAALRQTKVEKLSGFVSGNLSLASAGERIAAQKRILNHMWCLDPAEREEAIRELERKLKVDDIKISEPRLMLSWDEVSEMSRNGIDFGAHTATHPVLAYVDITNARKEILGAKCHMESQLKSRIKSFAYPVGRRQDFTSATKTLVREAGFDCALTMISGNNEAGSDLYELRRIAPWDEDPRVFALRLSCQKFPC